MKEYKIKSCAILNPKILETELEYNYQSCLDLNLELAHFDGSESESKLDLSYQVQMWMQHESNTSLAHLQALPIGTLLYELHTLVHPILTSNMNGFIIDFWGLYFKLS